ncbi:MAG: rod shape-determining protein MreC [Holophaga sp.]
MRERPWGLGPAGRRRWAIAALLLGHLGWMALGRGSSGRWRHLLDLLATPPRAASARWETWKASRRERIGSLRQAQTEILNLRAQVTALQTARAAEAPRLAEADEAVRVLGLKKLLPLDFKAARVVVNVRKAPFGGMILDRGEDAGLVPDQGVICPDGVVGRIWDVGLKEASLLPLDSYNASTGVMLARSRATGVLQGLGPGKAAIRYIGAQEVVQVGEPVFTSGLDRIFPRGLLVGYVSSVQPHDVELHVEVVLAAPLDRVGLVLILPPHPQMEIQPPSGPPQPAAVHPQASR